MNQNLLLKLSRWALGLLGVGVAAGSCDVLAPCEYGTPTMKYTVQGKVVDSKTGNGIPGIKISRVTFSQAQGEFTDANGEFILEGQSFPNDTIHVHALDIDGADNGFYTNVESVINLTKMEEGDGNWYSGKYAASNVVIRLEEEKMAE